MVIDNLITGSQKNIEPFLKKNNFHFINGDLVSFDLSKVLKKRPFDAIFHLASPASPKQYMKYPIETLLVNSSGSHKILNYARETGSKKIIYASTSEVYGDPLVHPQPETYWGNVNPAGPRACYDEAKRFGEAISMSYFRKFDLDVAIARIFNTYGPNMEKDDGRVISNFVVQALTEDDITVYGEGMQTRSFCYVSDLIEALDLMFLKKTSGEIINLGNTNEIKIIEIANLIKKITKSSSKIIFMPLPADDPKRRKPDISKASRLLNWSPKIDLEKGIDSIIDYFIKRFSL